MDKGYKRSKFQPNRMTNKWVIKSQNIGYSSPTLDCLFESNPTFTDWNETCARWKAWGHESLGQLVENSESLVFEFWALKVDIYQCLTPNNFLTDSPIFLKNIINYKYGPRVSLDTIFNPIGEGLRFVFFNLFVHQTISSPYISTCTACSALLFGPNTYLSNTYETYKKRPCSMRINRVITVLPFSRPNFYRAQCKIYGPFSSGCLAPNPLTFFMYVGINSLRIRIHLQHRSCFPLPAIGVKPFIYNMFGDPYYRCDSIYHYHILQACWYGYGLQTSPNFGQIGWQKSELLRVKILDIPHQLWTAYLSQIRPSSIGMKPVPDERPGAMSHWGNWSKILRAFFSSSGRWKYIFTNIWHLINF